MNFPELDQISFFEEVYSSAKKNHHFKKKNIKGACVKNCKNQRKFCCNKKHEKERTIVN